MGKKFPDGSNNKQMEEKMAGVLELTEEEFDGKTAEGIFLVDFWAEWCGPCRMLGPVLDQVAAAVDGKASVVKMNVDDAQNLAKKSAINSITVRVISNYDYAIIIAFRLDFVSRLW